MYCWGKLDLLYVGMRFEEVKYHEYVLRCSRDHDICFILRNVIVGRIQSLIQYNPWNFKDWESVIVYMLCGVLKSGHDVAATEIQPNCIVGLMHGV